MKRSGLLPLMLSIAAIALLTLTPTGPGGSSPGFCILCGTRGLSDFLANILMFAPFGFALALRGHALGRTALLGAILTLGIETAQLSLISGRDANVGDVLANTLGTLLGWFVGITRGWWTARDDDMRRCLAVTFATVAVLFAGLIMFTPWLPHSTWHMQWAARFDNMAAYEGRVISTRIGPLVLPGNQRIAESDRMRRMLFREPLEVVATAARSITIAPIVSIYDDERREIILLGVKRSSMIFRYRMLADAVRLDHGDLRVEDAFEHVPAGTEFRMVWSVDRAGYCLGIEARTLCGPGFTVGDSWTLLMPLDWRAPDMNVFRSLWLWLLFLPAGLLAARVRTLAAAQGLTIFALVSAPLLAGFAMTPLFQIAAACVGLASGALLSRRRRMGG